MRHNAEQLAETVGVSAACSALGLPRSSYYRRPRASTEAQPSLSQTPIQSVVEVSSQKLGRQQPRRAHPRGLTSQQQQRILDVCASERFIDCSPAHIVAALLDDGEYIGSERTFYRVLGAEAPLVDRRRQRRHPSYAAPQLVASGVNRVWTWDITKLKGPHVGACYHLYVIIDIYSRYVVGWAVFDRESEHLAKLLIETTCQRQQIPAGQLTIHADRGPAMRSGDVAELLALLEITKSHSRPYCSNDNPYSESQFKTLKYSAGFPERFGSLEDARAFCRAFFEWYNHQHRHSGIAMLTPSSVHYGQAEAIIAHRDSVLADAYREHPERFVKGQPKARRLPEAVWINPPVVVQPPPSAEPTSERGGSNESPPVVNPQRPEGSHDAGFSTSGDDSPAPTRASGLLAPEFIV